SVISPAGVCGGATTAPPTGGPPPNLNRIEGGWYTLPGQHGYYGSDSGGHGAIGQTAQQGMLAGIDDGCGPTGKIAYDAAAIADPDIDYNDFDTDKDGLVDFFNVVFAGDGGNLSISATGANNVWPHSSDLRSYFRDANGQTGYVSNDQFRNRLNQLVYYTDATRTAETTTPTAFPKYVRVGSYNVNPESALDFVSVIAHEYGHSLGMPDYYSTGDRSTFGSWDLNGTDYFQYHSVFSRQDLGWVVPRPLTSGQVTLTESKFDTGQIHWQRPDGTPYTLTGPGIHNADVYRLGLPPRILIDKVPSGVRAWYSGQGNDFGCATDGRGHNLDFFIPDLKQHASASTVTLKIKHLWEMEWDFDYGFVLVSEDGGVTWTSLPSKSAQSSTIIGAYNPRQNQCQASYGNGITGVSDGQGNTVSNPNRINDDYPPAQFVQDQFDLTAYKGKSIILRFSYATDAGLAKRGWFIDDIEITADSTTVYKSDFEASPERTRIFPFGWNWVSSAEGAPSDHAYYLELRARISNDFDGKGQSERGGPGFQGGISMIYTDEAHGYGNFGVDDPPAQTPVDSTPDPGSKSPNLNDAAFTTAAGRSVFDGCTHIDNYDADPLAEAIPWKLPPHLKFTVTSINGLTQEAALPAQPATATIQAEIYPECAGDLLPPTLAIGSGYENPDTNGSYQLTWQRPPGATGPDELQVGTSCGPTFVDNASTALVGGDNTLWDGSPQWTSNTYTSDPGNLKYYIPNGAAQDDSLTQKTAIAIPAGFSSTLTFDTVQGLEAGYDFGYVEVSTNNGSSWKTVASYSGPGELPDQVFVGTRTIDLTEFAGQSVKLRFRVESDSFNVGQPLGWYIDNITISNSDWKEAVTTAGTSFTDHKGTGSYCYRARTSYQVGSATLPSAFSNVVNVTVAPGVPRVVSRKIHGTGQGAQAFDVDLPLASVRGIDSRRGTGANSNQHQVVFQFAQPVTFTGASAEPEPGKSAQVMSTSGSGTNEVVVNLGNVTNVQTIRINLTGVTGGGAAPNITVLMGVLLGDSSSDGTVNVGDAQQTRNRAGQAADVNNFRSDVNTDGIVNSGDAQVVRGRSSDTIND
ncbi:MAG TPA: immune inhibitor A domain-containing protein, partial [Chthoniobacterales bacterium]